MSKRFTKQITAQIPRGTLVLYAGAIALWMSGCTTGEEAVVSSVSPSSTAKPAQAFAKPTVSAKDPVKSGIVGLLQSTDPSERARQVQRGISTGKDPFSSVPPIVSFKVPITLPPGTESTVPSGSQTPVTPKPEVSTKPDIGSKPVAMLPKPEQKSPIRPLPPLPDSSLAKAVQVTGVIVVGGLPQAIVQAPNEATSRYVQVGQRISNGQVLVKRIEMNNGSDPIVILEQNGVEVARAVGSPAASPTSPTPPAPPTAMTSKFKLFG